MAITFGTTAGNWSDASKWVGGVKPTTGDDVLLIATSGAVTVNENTAALNSFNCSTYTAALTGASDITVTVASGTSTVLFAGTSPTWSGVLKLNPAAGTTINLTMGSLTTAGTCGGITIAGTTTGVVELQDSCTIGATKTFTLTSGTFDTNGNACSWGFYTGSSTTRTLTLGASAITMTGTSTGTGFILGSTNSTLTSNTATITFTGADQVFNGGDKIFYDLVFQPTSSCGLNGLNNASGAARNITITGTGASKTIYASIVNTTSYISGNLTINGASSTARILFRSDTLGTSREFRILTGGDPSFSNCDFRDIHLHCVDHDPFDASGATGGSGDCGGNTGITFTTADDWYWNGSGTRNFSDYTYWYTATNGGGTQMGATRCVLPQDTAYFDADSIDGATTIDQDMPRVCKTLDFTGVDAMAFHMNNINQTLYGGLTFVSNVTISNDKSVTFESMDRSGSYNLDMGGKALWSSGSTALNINVFGATLVVTSDISETSSFFLSHNNGTFDVNADITIGYFSSSGTAARTLLMGSGTWTISGTANNPWDMGTTLPPTGLTNPTTMRETSSIVLTDSTVGDANFRGGSCTYNNLTINTGSGNYIIAGSNTFATFTINAPKTVKFTAGTDQTVTSFVATGSVGNTITLDSTSAAEAKLSDTAGTNAVTYCVIGTTGKVTVEGGATWTYDANSTLTSGDGWTAAGGAVIPLRCLLGVGV